MMSFKSKYYAGIGSRKTPIHILKQMTYIATFLNKYRYILRSGGAKGADQAFEIGAINKEIYLPWPGFESKKSLFVRPAPEAYEIMRRFHPAPNRLSKSAEALLARNSHQILGLELNSPVDFVICWTPDGKASGGTGQAMRIAEHYNIPIWNLYYSSRYKEFLESFE